MRSRIILFILCTVQLRLVAVAQAPQTLSYQGLLTTSGGAPVRDSSYALAFKLYTTSTGGSPVWTESRSAVPVSSGTFSVILGSVTPLAGLNLNQQLYLGVTKGSDPEFSPRTVLTSSPSSLAPWSINGSNISFANGNVGIGTTSPAGKLHVNGDAFVGPMTAPDFGPDGSNLFIANTAGDFHNSFRLDTYQDNLYIVGHSSAGASTGTGIAFRTGGPGEGEVDRMVIDATGHVGIGPALLAAALLKVYSPTETAVMGEGEASYGYLGHGQTGAEGVTIGSGGYGVFGSGTANGSYGVYAQGNLGADGTKSFRIDHPRDPTNKYLLHYSAESPDVLNMYTGNVVTDASGYATITLPDYFDDINKDPRYSLTVINEGGSDFVQAMVVQKVRDNRFVIRTSKPAVEISWRVDAVRNDLWVRQNGAPVVQEKKGAARGKYQHPELYGAPKEMGEFYRKEMDSAAKQLSGAMKRK